MPDGRAERGRIQLASEAYRTRNIQVTINTFFHVTKIRCAGSVCVCVTTRTKIHLTVSFNLTGCFYKGGFPL